MCVVVDMEGLCCSGQGKYVLYWTGKVCIVVERESMWCSGQGKYVCCRGQGWSVL